MFAGNFRPAGVKIEGSKHEPPGAHLVPELIEDLCDYVNDHWQPSTPIHLAAYVMWRLNWIHPFADGNGRTSRIVSYVVLSVRAGAILPGTPTIPDQIVDNRSPYFDALDAADVACSDGRLNVSKMEELLGALLARQLTSFYQSVGGKIPASNEFGGMPPARRHRRRDHARRPASASPRALAMLLVRLQRCRIAGVSTIICRCDPNPGNR